MVEEAGVPREGQVFEVQQDEEDGEVASGENSREDR